MATEAERNALFDQLLAEQQPQEESPDAIFDRLLAEQEGGSTPTQDSRPIDLLEQGRGFVAGAREESESIGAGILDLALWAAQALPSEAAQNLSTQGRIALAALRDQSAREFAEETEGVEGAATAGRLATAIGTGAAVPLSGGVGGSLLGGIARGTSQGAALNQIPFVEADENRVQRAVTGAAGGLAGTAIGRSLDRGIRALARRRATREAATRPSRQQRVMELRSRGADEVQAERAVRMEKAGFEGDAAPIRSQITRAQEEQRLENTLAATQPGGPIRERLLAQQNVARDTLKRREREFGTGEEDINPIVRSARVEEALQTAEKVSRRLVRNAWKKAERNAPDARLETQNFERVMEEVFDEGGDDAVTVAQRQLKRHAENVGGFNVLTPKGARVIEEKMSKLASQAYGGTNPDRKLGMFYNRLQDALNDDMAQIGGNAFGDAKAASQRHFQKFKDVKNIRRFLRGQLQPDDVIPGIMGGWKNRDAVNFIRGVKENTAEGFDELKSGVIQELALRSRQGTALDQTGEPVLSPANMRRAWDRIRPGVKNTLFTKTEKQEMDDFVTAFQELFTSVPGTVNTSQSTNAFLDAIQNMVGSQKLTPQGRVLAGLVRGLRRMDVRGRQAEQIEQALRPFERTERGAPSRVARAAAGGTRGGVTESIDGTNRTFDRGRLRKRIRQIEAGDL